MTDEDSEKSFSSCTEDDQYPLYVENEEITAQLGEDVGTSVENMTLTDGGDALASLAIDSSPQESNTIRSPSIEGEMHLSEAEVVASETHTERGQEETSTSEEPAAIPTDVQTNRRVTIDAGSTSQVPDSLSPTAAISNGFVLPTADARLAVLNRLRLYEAKRRPYYQGKLASSLVYWRSLCELMAQSLEDTERVESLILANIEMQKTIAEHCNGVVEDKIDVDGKLLVDIKKAKKLQEEKKTKYNNMATFWKSNLDHTILHKLLGFTQTQTTVPTAVNDDFKKLIQQSNMLASVLDFHTSTADRFTENSLILREEAWLPLMTLRSKLDAEVNLMEKMGGVIMAQLESAENTIQQSWSHYYSTEKSCINALRTQQYEPNSTIECNVEDAWIAEMQYVMAVAYSKSLWLKSSSRMAKLFASIKETECHRRSIIRDILTTFMKKQEILYLGIQSIVSPIVRDLSDRPLDRTTVERQVHESIQFRAEELDRISNKAVDVDESLSNIAVGQELSADFEPSPPLLSELLCKANVIERKTGVLGWKTSLAISTADGFLHLFDLSSDLPVQSGSAAEVAFHALCPSIEIPSESSAKSSKVVDFGKKMIESLTPSETIKLKNAQIVFNDLNGNSIFEVTETSEKSRSVFGKTITKRLTLRTISRAETVAWVAALKGAKVDWRYPWNM